MIEYLCGLTNLCDIVTTGRCGSRDGPFNRSYWATLIEGGMGPRLREDASASTQIFIIVPVRHDAPSILVAFTQQRTA